MKSILRRRKRTLEEPVVKGKSVSFSLAITFMTEVCNDTAYEDVGIGIDVDMGVDTGVRAAVGVRWMQQVQLGKYAGKGTDD